MLGTNYILPVTVAALFQALVHCYRCKWVARFWSYERLEPLFLKYLWHSLTWFWQPPVSLGQMLQGSPWRDSLYFIWFPTIITSGGMFRSHPMGLPAALMSLLLHCVLEPMCSMLVSWYLVTWLPKRPRKRKCQSSICQQEPVSRAPSKPSSEPEVQWRKFVLRVCWCLLLQTRKRHYHLFVFLGFESSSTCSCRLQQSKNYNMACVFW